MVVVIISESEHSFSTLKRIKTCLRGTMREEILDELSIYLLYNVYCIAYCIVYWK